MVVKYEKYLLRTAIVADLRVGGGAGPSATVVVNTALYEVMVSDVSEVLPELSGADYHDACENIWPSEPGNQSLIYLYVILLR